jgi:L-aminopeptidase/D-esterase-like protein
LRSRDLGIVRGDLQAGPPNAITDVAGTRVGHAGEDALDHELLLAALRG